MTTPTQIEEIAERAYNIASNVIKYSDLSEDAQENYRDFATAVLTEHAKLNPVEVGGWVKVSDRLPTEGDALHGLVLVHEQNGFMRFYHYTNIRNSLCSHWRSLPTPPPVEPERDECLEKFKDSTPLWANYVPSDKNPEGTSTWKLWVQAWNASREALAGKGEGK